MTESEPRDGAEPSGEPPPPPPEAATAVAVMMSSAETEACGEEPAAGEGKMVVEGRQEEGRGKAEAAAVGACVVIDVGRGDGGEGDAGDAGLEKMCRICHLSPDQAEDASELIQLGCGCKDELGIAHRRCAEAWFKLKGNRYCEICGANAKNITGEEDSRFMEAWHDRRALSSRNSSQRSACWRRQFFCNFLMACLVIAFVLSWFFRVNIF